jgi:CRP/FNR family transcriptional regulator, cyclic AMP receptor protein
MAEVFPTGDIFGEIGAIDGGVRSTATVVEDRVRLMRISQAQFPVALSRDPALGVSVCGSVSAHAFGSSAASSSRNHLSP